MVRIAKKSDPAKIAELKRKINDKDYLDLAIYRIATIITRCIVRED